MLTGFNLCIFILQAFLKHCYHINTQHITGQVTSVTKLLQINIIYKVSFPTLLFASYHSSSIRNSLYFLRYLIYILVFHRITPYLRKNRSTQSRQAKHIYNYRRNICLTTILFCAVFKMSSEFHHSDPNNGAGPSNTPIAQATDPQAPSTAPRRWNSTVSRAILTSIRGQDAARDGVATRLRSQSFLVALPENPVTGTREERSRSIGSDPNIYEFENIDGQYEAITINDDMTFMSDSDATFLPSRSISEFTLTTEASDFYDSDAYSLDHGSDSDDDYYISPASVLEQKAMFGCKQGFWRT